MVVPGCWANPEATAASFTAGHWHSGDPGSVDAQGYVRAFCAARLADYKVPETVTWSDTPLPHNANGKLMKRRLRDRLPAVG